MTVAANEEWTRLPQPSDLSTDEGRVWLCAQACVLAEREADRGEQARAADALQKAMGYAKDCYRIDLQGRALSYYALANDYVKSKAADVDELRVAAIANDADYVNNQRLSVQQAADFAADNADTAAALEAAAEGRNPTLAYNLGPVTRTLRDTAESAKEAVRAARTPVIVVGLAVLACAVAFVVFKLGR